MRVGLDSLAGGPKSAVVAARLLVDGEDQGVFLFLTPLSDERGHLPGVRVRRLADRTGTPVDHCLTSFDHVRLPREAMLWKLDGLSEYDVRRPMVPTGTNLLGLVKHLASVELGYFGETFGRPSDPFHRHHLPSSPCGGPHTGRRSKPASCIVLSQQQRDRNITPQCEVNGTLVRVGCPR